MGYAHAAGSSISNCYNLGEINGANDAGGILGYTYSDIKCRNCYSAADMTGTNVGGIIGGRLYNSSANIFKNCYYLKNETVTKPGGQTFTIEDNGLTELTRRYYKCI